MGRRIRPHGNAALIALPAVVLVGAGLFSGGAPAGYTGAPGDATCATCHSAIGASGGSIDISGPDHYTPGTPVDITIVAERPEAVRFGFQITVRDESGMMVGSFEPALDQDFSRDSNNDPVVAYVTHSPAPFDNDGDDRHEFVVRWNPPSEPDGGEVTFYATVNTANGDNTTFGDVIHTGLLTLPRATANEAPSELPAHLVVDTPFPNPALWQTRLGYALPRPAHVSLDLVDVSGRVVQTVDGGMKSTGFHSMDLDVVALTPGTYVYRLRAGEESRSGKLLVLK